MKKLLLLFCAAALFSCSVLHPVQEHKSNFVYVVTKPANIDSATIDDNNLYHIEGYICPQYPTLKPILIFVRGAELRKIMQIPWPTGGIRMDQPFDGYAFSADDLGEKSYMTKGEVNNSKFTEDEKQQLMKDRKTQKYMIRNVLPILVTVKITGENVVLVRGTGNQQNYQSIGPNVGNQNQQNNKKTIPNVDHTQDQ